MLNIEKHSIKMIYGLRNEKLTDAVCFAPKIDIGQSINIAKNYINALEIIDNASEMCYRGKKGSLSPVIDR